MVFKWNLRDSMFPQVSWILLSILTNCNNAVLWMVSAHPLIPNSASALTRSLCIIPRAPTTIGITVTFMFQNFFMSLAKIIVIILLIREFFTPALTNGFLLESWVTASLLKSTLLTTDRSEQCSNLDGLHLSSYSQVLQSLYQTSDDCTERIPSYLIYVSTSGFSLKTEWQ